MRRRLFYGWVVVAIGTVITIVNAGTRTTLGAFLLPIERDTGWTKADISFAASMGLLLYGLGAPFGGWLMRRFGLRRTTIAALAVSAVSMFMSARSQSLGSLAFWFGLVSGLGSGMIAGPLGATVANRWFVNRRGLVTGIFGAATSAGLLAFYPLLTWMAVANGWRWAASGVGWIVAALLAPAAFLLRDDPADVGLQPLGGEAETVTSPDGPVMGRAIRSPEFWLLFGTFAVCGATSNGLVGQHFIPHAVDHGFTELVAANWLAVMGAFNFVGAIVSGQLTDRIDPRRLLLGYYSFRGVSLFLLPYVHDNASIAVFAILFGLDYIATVPPTIMLCADKFGRRNAGEIYGWVFAGHQFGAAVAAWAAGAVRDGAGAYDPAFVAAGGVAVAAGLMALMIPRSSKLTPA
ncbi:MAG: MFS transporter [Acidimicrobiia bacterium]|nr:MFS transporter [Acidimicrobiia bacterium]MDH5294936.1 MFS transporter [Acidimicrobiia bacterium]